MIARESGLAETATDWPQRWGWMSHLTSTQGSDITAVSSGLVVATISSRMRRATGSPPVRSLAHVLAIALSLSAGACTGELTLVDPAGGGGGGGGGGADAGGGGGGGGAGEAMFNDEIVPLFSSARPKGACIVCHGNVAPVDPDFLGMGEPADRYPTIMGFTSAVTGRKMVGTSAADSELLLKGDHPTGDAFCTGAGAPYAACTTDEVTLISDWIALENE